MKDLVFEIELQTSSMTNKDMQSITISLFNHLNSWPQRINKKPASLAVHLLCDFNYNDNKNFDNAFNSLINTMHNIFRSGASIIWMSFEYEPDGNFSALEECNFRKVLEIFFGYYEKCSLLMYYFFSLR